MRTFYLLSIDSQQLHKVTYLNIAVKGLIKDPVFANLFWPKTLPQVYLVITLSALALATEEEKKEKVSPVEERKDGKTEKRGLYNFGYGHGHGSEFAQGHSAPSSGFGGFGHLGSGSGFEHFGGGSNFGHFSLPEHHETKHEAHIKAITITKEVKIPVPQPYPVHVEKKVPYPVKVPVEVKVEKPYPVHVPKPYPVYIEKKVPYPVEKKVPYPVKVEVKVPVPVPHPVHVPKPYPVKVPVPKPYPVKVPVYIEKKIPIYIKEHHHDYHHGGYHWNYAVFKVLVEALVIFVSHFVGPAMTFFMLQIME